jgi:hypothetical protein
VKEREESAHASASIDRDRLGVERAAQIDWSHERLQPLSDAARLVYACLVDGLSVAARDTIDSVDLVWRTRHQTRRSRRFALRETEMRETLDEICIAVEELVEEGLVILRDARTIRGAWVMRPWESSPS